MRLPQAAAWGLVVASAAAENASSPAHASSPANATLAPTGASEAFGNATASNATQEYVDPLDQLQAAVGEAFNFTCPPGAYAMDTPFLPCRWCPTGRYSATAGAKSCGVCDVGYYATDPRKAVDGVGLTIAASTCAMCPANMYSRNGSFQCAQCSLAAGEGSEPGAGGCVCAAGFYDAAPGEDAPSCKSCDVAGVRSCPMGTTIATLPVKRGWWRATPSSDDVEAARRGRTSINDSFSHVLDLFSLNRHHKHAATGASPPAAPPEGLTAEPLRFDDGGDDDAAGDASPAGLAPSCEVSADGFDVVDVRASSPAGSPAGSTASPPRSPMSAAIIDTEHCGVACLPGLVTDDDCGGDDDRGAADAYADLVSVLSFT